ncbi:MAG: branched-chain amino acid transport system substrate-binding protein [Actinomycetota bacterium]|jgi:branched-chain amino acid transport system substrate-binding protein|nr:branched-chain amino acid transport system substrate-binding protein [Actinomycetota bacterium]
MKSSKWMALAALLTVVALVGAACGGDDKPTDGTNPPAGGGDCTWVIGTMGALSGDVATIGQPIFKGIQFGVDTVNESGDLPCQLQLESEDTQGSEDQAPPLAQELAQNPDVVAVVGPYFSGETAASGDTFAEANIPIITPSATNPDLSKNGWPFFRLLATDEASSTGTASYLSDVAKFSTVVVLHDNSEYGKALAELVRQKVGDSAVGDLIAINPEEDDFSAQISAAKATGAEALFFGGYEPEFRQVIKQGKDAGFDAVYVSGDGSKGTELPKEAAAEGAIVICPCDDPVASANPAANQFAKDYEASVGEPVSTYSIEGYDGVQLVAAALAAGGFDGDTAVEDIRAGLIDWFHSNVYEGLSKSFEFDDNGELATETVYAYEVKNGAYEQLGIVSELAGQ